MNELSNVKGIGKITEQKLNKLNIFSIEDLINYYPFRYDVLKKTSLNNEKVVVVGSIESNITVNYFKNINRLKFKLLTEDKLINVEIYNRMFLKPNLYPSKEITVIGKYDKNKNLLTASDIKLFTISDKTIILPVYHLVKGINNKSINNYINKALLLNKEIDYIPKKINDKYTFMSKKEALFNIHNPSNEKKLKQAIIRCKYEELFIFMLKINELINRNKKLLGYKKNINIDKINEFISILPFELTIDQKKCLNDILDDLKSDKRMNRLVQGDVGSGKTIVSIISMYAVYLDGYQSTLMAPTEILATQHYENINNLLKKYNVNIKLLTSSTKKKEREIILKELQEGKINILIGTHSLLNDEIKFNNLGLIITDEQHRFGVNQRSNLRNKGNLPDVLYLSATPIPRTYALTIYKDMDLSIINTKPIGRKDVITKVINNKDIKYVLEMINKELKQNHQIYIVSPLIESEDNDEEIDAKKLQKKFSLAFKNYNVGLLHGKMKPKEKDEIMNKFINNEINILVSTTVIEVGVDVKNATTIVIFNAYRFGLSTLHQLRGRVGRNSLDSYCYLITDRESERLKIMEKTTDGFKLSEEDFKLRGSGDLFGTKQSGDMKFKIANITKDYKILLKAKKDSEEILKEIKKYKNLKKILDENINQD